MYIDFAAAEWRREVLLYEQQLRFRRGRGEELHFLNDLDSTVYDVFHAALISFRHRDYYALPLQNLTPRKRPEKSDNDTPSSMKESRDDVMMSDNRIIDEFRGRQLKRPSNAHVSSSELYSESDELEEEKDENLTGEEKKVAAIRGMSGLKHAKRAETKSQIKRDIEKDIRDSIEEWLRSPGRETMTPEEIAAEVERREIEYRKNQEAIRKKRIARELTTKEKEAEEMLRIQREFKNKLTDLEKEKKHRAEMNRKLYEERLLNESKQNEESEEYLARKREQIQKLEEERLLKEEARKNAGSIRLNGPMAERSPLLV